jgi:hypothetical protein
MLLAFASHCPKEIPSAGHAVNPQLSLAKTGAGATASSCPTVDVVVLSFPRQNGGSPFPQQKRRFSISPTKTEVLLPSAGRLLTLAPLFKTAP